MTYRRRQFLVGSGALLLTGLELAVRAAPPGTSGRAPITRKELDSLVDTLRGSSMTCERTAEANEGPFYYESSPERRLITDGHPGLPLRLGITVAGVASTPGPTAPCAPLPGAIVDVWHADAAGLYSNVGSDLQMLDTTGQMFLRGHQVTDERGYVEFETIVPGWEIVPMPAPVNVQLRTTHLHVKVFHERKVLTTQLYFPDLFLDELYTDLEPYKSHARMTAPGLREYFARIPNASDRIFVVDQGRPMPIRRDKGVAVANVTIAFSALPSRGIVPLFR